MYSTNVSPSLLPSRPVHCGSVAPSAGSSRLFVQPPEPSVGFSKLALLTGIGAASRTAIPKRMVIEARAQALKGRVNQWDQQKRAFLGFIESSRPIVKDDYLIFLEWPGRF